MSYYRKDCRTRIIFPASHMGQALWNRQMSRARVQLVEIRDRGGEE